MPAAKKLGPERVLANQVSRWISHGKARKRAGSNTLLTDQALYVGYIHFMSSPFRGGARIEVDASLGIEVALLGSCAASLSLPTKIKNNKSNNTYIVKPYSLDEFRKIYETLVGPEVNSEFPESVSTINTKLGLLVTGLTLLDDRSKDKDKNLIKQFTDITQPIPKDLRFVYTGN